jgi:LCP family protein required for cell wall assembly
VALRGGQSVVAVVSVAVLALTWYGWQYLGDLNSGVTTTDLFEDREPRAVPLDGAVDILLVGQDSRTDAQGNPLSEEVLAKLHAGKANGERNTDTMILVHIPQDGTRAVAFSFPRDSWVEIAGGYGKHKLNSAFVYAFNDTFRTLRAQGEKDTAEIEKQAKVAGRKNLITTIERFIGKPGLIDRYAEVNLASFYEVTKALGGVKVCLKNPVNEPKSGVHLPAGVQEIQGAQALAFVRQRYGLPRFGLDRIARQQAFLSGMVRKVLSTDVLMNPSKLRDVVEAVQKSVVLSEGWDLLQFAAQMRNLSGGKVEFHTIPVVGSARIGGADVLEVDEQEVRAFVDGLISGGAPGSDGEDAGETVNAGRFTVELYNGTGDPETGPEGRTVLQDKGFQGESYATVDPIAESAILYAPGEQRGADAVRQALGEQVPVESDDEVPSGTLRLVLGTDFDTGTGGAASEPGTARPGDERQQYLGSAHAYRAAGPGKEDEADTAITAGGVPCVN